MIFLRKSNITSMMRVSIGATAVMNSGVYGAITDLANKYEVSRPFIYQQKAILLDAFKVKALEDKSLKLLDEKKEVNKLILALKFCCKSSNGGISEALKALGYKNNSVGYISEFLNNISEMLIEKLPTLDTPINILADEIFVCGQPILVILDAFSHTILAIELAKNRKGDTWGNCYQSLIDKGYKINIIAKDLGSGLQKGIDLVNESNNINIVAVADLFHLLVRFNPYIASLEKRAIGLIEKEEKTFAVLENRKSKESLLKTTTSLLETIDKCDEAMTKYDIYEYLRKELHTAFNPFNENGTFRNMKIIHGDVMAILDLLEEEFCNHNKIKDAIKFLRKNINGYAPYLTQIENILKKYKMQIPEYLMKEICLSYQKALKSIAIKDPSLSKKIDIESKDHLKLVVCCARNDNEQSKLKCLLSDLQKSVRSSSALEAKNSVLRSYINAMSGQITQSHLKLIAFYMNHKISIRGKYKGKSPLERFTGIKSNQNFIDLLLAI